MVEYIYMRNRPDMKCRWCEEEFHEISAYLDHVEVHLEKERKEEEK